MKNGIKTTEFWLMALGWLAAVALVVIGHFSDVKAAYTTWETGLGTTGAITLPALYGFLRTWLKSVHLNVTWLPDFGTPDQTPAPTQVAAPPAPTDFTHTSALPGQINDPAEDPAPDTGAVAQAVAQQVATNIATALADNEAPAPAAANRFLVRDNPPEANGATVAHTEAA